MYWWSAVVLICVLNANGVMVQGMTVVSIHVQDLKINPLDAPKIIPMVKEMVLTEYEAFKVICSTMKGSAPLQYTWLKNTQPVASDSNIQITTIENTLSTLIIEKIQSNHSGNYTCKVRNSHGHDQVSVNLHVKGKFRKFFRLSLIFAYVFETASLKWIHEPHDVKVRLGEEVTIPCEARGYPEPSISWSKVKSTEDYSNHGSSLRIFRATVRNAGQYECVAKNSVGEKLSKTISVTVFGENDSNVCAKLI